MAGPAARAIAEQPPENVAVAVIEFITGALIEDPTGSVENCAPSWWACSARAEARIGFWTASTTTGEKSQ